MTERARAPGRPLRNALRNLSLKGLSLGLERVCRLVVVVAAARVLGQATFGRFVFASTVTALLALGTDLGLGVWTTRTLARSRVDGGRVVGVGLALRGLATLPYGFAVAGVAMVAVRGEARAAVALLGVAALVNAFVDHFGAILCGYERFADEAWLNASRAFLTAAAGLVTLTVGHSLAGLCAALAAASLGSCVYGLVTLVRLHPFPASPTRSPLIGTLVGALRGTVNRAVAKIALRESLPIWFAGLLSLLYFKVDTLFLRSMAGDSELGAYGAAYKFFEGAMILPFVLLSVTFPQLARALENPPAQRRLERQIGLLLLALGLFAGAACLLGAAPLVRVVFGDGFDRAVASLRVLSLGLPFLYLNFGLTHFLLARDMGRVTTWLALMMLALNVALDLALIPRRGGPGAAWATVLSEVALTACCLAALRTRLAPAHMPRSVPAAAKTDQTAA